jgi:hypothetical protein
MCNSGKWKVFVLLLCCLMADSAVAASSDTFTITVTCRFLDIVLKTYDGGTDYTTWAIGAKNEGTATTMTEAQGIKLVNTSNVATNITAYVSGQAGSWTNAAAAGPNQYLLELKAYDATEATPDLGSGTTAVTSTAGPGESVKASLAATTDQWVYCKFTTPASTTSGAQQSITVTILATAS